MRARALHTAALLNGKLGDLEAAVRQAEAAVAIAEEEGRPDLSVLPLAVIAFLGAHMPDGLERSLICGTRAVALAGARSMPWELGWALNCFGAARLIGGDNDGARAAWTAALQIFRDLGDARNERVELANLAEFHLQQGNWTEAEPLLEQVLALAHPSIDDDLTAQTLINHAVVRLFAEDTETAEAALDEAHTLARKVGDKRSIGDCLLVRAALAAARGDHADAGRLGVKRETR